MSAAHAETAPGDISGGRFYVGTGFEPATSG